MDVIGLLQSKKRCLRRFLEVSEDFLSEATRGELSGLGHFEEQRERALKTLALIDRRLTEAAQAVPMSARTPALSAEVKGNLDEETAIVEKIARVDHRIVDCIENEKRKLLRDLAAHRKSHEMTGRFRSTWIAEAGDGLDEKA